MPDLRPKRRAAAPAAELEAVPPLLAAGARRHGPAPLELLTVGMLLLAAGFALLGYNVVHGGFMWDDWFWASLSRFPSHSGLFGGVAPQVGDHRPLLAEWLAILFRVLGRDAHLHLAVVVVFSALAALSFFVLLRTLGLPLRHALAIALLSMLFPWSDSIRLYTVNGANNLPVILYPVGVTVSVAGLRRRGASAVALALVGAGLYVLSVLTYEVAAVLALCGIGFYRFVAPWRRALPRWTLDLVVVGLAIGRVEALNPRAPHSLHANAGHAKMIVQQGLELLRSALVPFDGIAGIALAAGLIALTLAAVARWRLGRLTAADVLAARRWLAIAIAAGVGIVAAYAVFIPGDIIYSPRAPGVHNRVNILAALGYATLIYALVMAFVRLSVRRRRPGGGLGSCTAARFTASLRSAPLAASVATLLVLAIGAGWVLRTVNDERDLARAADRRAQIVETVSRVVPRPDPTSFIYTFGEPRLIGAWPVFATSWDLRAALRLRYGDPSLDGRTVRSDVVWVCGYQRMAPVRVRRTLGKLKLSHYTYAVPYRSAVFVDVPGRRAQHIDSRAECRTASQHFVERQLDRLHDLSPRRTALVRMLLGPRGERLVEAYFHNPRTGRAKIARLQRAAHGTGGDGRTVR